MQKVTNIIIDDGLKDFQFSNNKGEVFAEFSFNPADTSIIERYDKVVDVFNGISFKGENDKDIEDYLVEVSNTFKEQFNFLLNREVSDTLFKVYSPITIFANGNFFAETLLEQLGKIIESELNVRLAKKAKKIEKYTQKYHK